MGIYGALSTAVSGLKAQSYALEHVSGNIANSQTVGYKRTETSFADMIPSSSYKKQIAGGVDAYSRGTNNVQGEVRNADIPTNMGINGEGYFIVEEEVGRSDGQPVFGGVDLYTRRGDFEVDNNGYFVNGAGYYLKGIRVDPQTGNMVGDSPEQIRLSNDLLPARQTTQITLRANLPTYPMTTNADPEIPDSELLDTGLMNGDRDIEGANVDDFLEQSKAGGAITVYDPSGGPVNIQFRWGKVESAETGTEDRWELFYLSDSSAGAGDVAWKNVGQDYVFDANQQLDPPIDTVDVQSVSVNGADLGDIVLKHGAQGVTQFSDPNGDTQVTDIRQNGYAAGELTGVSISEEGRVVASYTNGRTVDLYKVELASFNSPNRLEKRDGGAFAATQDSGAAILGAQGTIVGSSIEGSNTEIADEFTKLIVTQQAYAAGTRIVTTSNEMLQEVLGMVR